MADDEKAHQKRLKEARKVLEKSYKLYEAGKIDQNELKERLRPFKAELVELGLVKGSKDERPAEKAAEVKAPEDPSAEGKASDPASVEPVVVPQHIRGASWQRRSNLTIDEVRRRIDQIGSSGPSEGLKESYRRRYGEDLSPPSEVTFQVTAGPEQPKAPQEAAPPSDLPAQQNVSDRSKGFLRSLFTKKNP